MKINNCCDKLSKNTKKCRRGKDSKIFKLPRKFTKQQCNVSNIYGFSKRSSCAPYKFCKKTKKTKKKQFLYNPDNPKKSFDVYIDKNPSDTIPIKYTTVNDVKTTIKNLEKLYKTDKYSHKRIWQVGMIMKIRLQTINKYKKTKYKNAKNIADRYKLSKKYFDFLKSRSKAKTMKLRKKLTFKF